MSEPNEQPSGDRISFHVEDDNALRIRVDDGALLVVKPVVVDVLKQVANGAITYSVLATMQISLKEPPSPDGVEP